MSGFSDSAFSAAPMSTPVQVDASAALDGVFAQGRIGAVSITGNARINLVGVSGDANVGNVFLWFPIDPNQNPNWVDAINLP